MSEEDLFTCFMYVESKSIVVELEKRLPEQVKQLTESMKEEKIITRKLGLNKAIAVKKAVDTIVNEPAV